MRMIQSKKVSWYRSVQFRLFACITLIYIVSSVIFGNLLYHVWENYWVNQKITEISRYANFLASDIAMNSLTSEEDPGQNLNHELQSFSRLYSYARMMILDEKAMVVQDSSQTKMGRYIVNDDVLMALSGKITNIQEDSFVRLAIPITDYSGSTVKGVVYVFFSVDTLLELLSINQGNITLLQFAIGVVACALFYVLIATFTKPFKSIIAWLKQVSSGNAEAPAEIQRQDEYGLIVEAIQDVTHDLIAIDRSRKEFVSNVSHELKTPITSVKVLAESLVGQEQLPVELYQEFMVDINQELERMNQIINDLLSLVRMDKNAAEVSISEVNVNEFVESILKQLRPIADQRNIDIIFESVRPVKAQMDEVKMGMAVRNLIENAIKYNYDDGWVRVSLNADHKFFYLKVSDSGVGIPEELQENIFERFYRVDKARSRETGGNGLGLAITRSAILLHRGSIRVHSEEQQGTTFNVRIPLIYLE